MKQILLPFILIVMLMVSCNRHDNPQETELRAGGVIVAAIAPTVSEGNPSDSLYHFQWKVGDEVGIVTSQGNITSQLGLKVDEVVDGKGILSNFSYSLNPDVEYLSYFPLQKAYVDYQSGVNFSFREQYQKGNDNTDHLPAYCFSTSHKKSFASSKTFEWEYTRQCALVTLDIIVWGEHTWTNVALMPHDVTKLGCKAEINDAIHYDFASETIEPILSKYNLIEMQLDEVSTSSTGEPAHVICHMMVPPCKMNGSKLMIRLNDYYGDVWFTTVDGIDFEANHDYRIKAEISMEPTYGRVDLGQQEGLSYNLKNQWSKLYFGSDAIGLNFGYYAWGELKEKANYYFDNYFDTRAYREGSDDGSIQGFLQMFDYYFGDGGKTSLTPDRDIVRIYWGGAWRMPTKEDISMITGYCDRTIEEGRSEYNMKSRVNGNILTFPFSGAKSRDKILQTESTFFWSSEMVEGSYINHEYRIAASASCFQDGTIDDMIRSVGLPIRPVWDPDLLK